MQHDHINPAFDQDIGQMDGYLVKMESSISEQLKMIRTAFAEMDVSLAQQIRRQDRRLNDLAINLERCAVGILARHQPVAEDLRHAVASSKCPLNTSGRAITSRVWRKALFAWRRTTARTI